MAESMKNSQILIAASAAALLSLAACSQEPEVVDANPDPQAEELAKAAPVTLPPAIKASKTYRCKDNSIVYVNFLTDDISANVRDKEEEPPAVNLKAPAPGEPFVGDGPAGDGFKLVGSGDTVTYTSPDSGTQSCKA